MGGGGHEARLKRGGLQMMSSSSASGDKTFQSILEKGYAG